MVRAAGLVPCQVKGKSDPYCTVVVGDESYRTHPVTGNLNPEWNDTFTFGGRAVAASGGIMAFEVWGQGTGSFW